MNLPFEGYLKRKNACEAADAGLLLWRSNFVFFILFFAIPFWICAFALRLLPENLKYLSWLILWYLKPLFDRPILHIISIRFFDNDADLISLFKGLGKNIFRGLPGDLLWRRFSPYRASVMPVSVLEEHKKIKQYSERKNILGRGGLGFSFLLTVWGIAMEIALLFGGIFFFFMIGNIAGKEFDISDSGFNSNAEIFLFAFWCVNYILIETMYICMGFGVYINSRIEVEGWDIEIVFKNFAEKLKKKKSIIALIVFCVFLFYIPGKSYAEEQELLMQAAPLEILENILSSSDFGGEKDSWRIKLKNQPEEKNETTASANNSFNEYFYSFLKKLEIFIASFLRVLLFLTAIVFVILIYFYARKRLVKNTVPEKNKSFLNILQEEKQNSDPQDLLDKAIELFSQNSKDITLIRLSWGYCTAAAILFIQKYNGFVFPANATELDCVKFASEKLETENLKEIFGNLINNWVNFAYGGFLPPDGSFEEAVAFCNSLKQDNEAVNG